MEDQPKSETVILDEEFKAGLNILRPFLLRLSSVEDAKLTRLWLKKLHESVEERKLRNVFLRELTEQVQGGKLRFPFNKPPPVAPLYLCQVCVYTKESFCKLNKRAFHLGVLEGFRSNNWGFNVLADLKALLHDPPECFLDLEFTLLAKNVIKAYGDCGGKASCVV